MKIGEKQFFGLEEFQAHTDTRLFSLKSNKSKVVLWAFNISVLEKIL